MHAEIPAADYEAEVLPGLEPWARAELETIGARVVAEREGELDVALAATHAGRLDALRRVTAVYEIHRFDVPRPKALLGDRHFRRLVAAVDAVRRRQRFEGFRFGAAGSDSTTFRRLADAIARATGLAFEPDDGELLLRVRPDPATAADGWQVLVRRTPRPLSARAWRVCNLPGGLNACVAAAMVDASGPTPGDRVLGAMCGSGTLLVERAQDESGPPSRLVGFDLDWDALACARENLEAAGVPAPELRLADAGTTGLASGAFDVILSDPPWGDAVGDHARNAALYPRFLDEAARLLAPRGRLVVLSHEVRLMDELLASSPGWRVTLERRVFHGGHWPRLIRLERVQDA